MHGLEVAHEARQVLEVVPVAVNLVGWSVDRDGLPHLHGVLLPARPDAPSGRLLSCSSTHRALRAPIHIQGGPRLAVHLLARAARTLANPITVADHMPGPTSASLESAWISGWLTERGGST